MKQATVLSFVFLLTLSTSLGEIRRYEDTDDDNGGPSSEFRPMGYEWKMEDLEYTPERLDELRALQKRTLALQPGRETNKLIKGPEDEKFFAALPGVLKQFEKELERTLKESHLEGIVTGRIKSMSSLLAKMEQDGVTDYHEITDIVGLRVTLQTMNDIHRFKIAYQNCFDKDIDEIRCYGTCGPAVGNSDPREKKYWPWRGSGYRRLHFKVKVSELNTDVEIQVGTPYMTLWAEWEHAVVYKGPEDLKNNENVKLYAQKLAGYYAMLDDVRNRMDPSCPRILKKTNAKKLFGQHDWKIFGSPRDACNFWNDLQVDMP